MQNANSSSRSLLTGAPITHHFFERSRLNRCACWIALVVIGDEGPRKVNTVVDDEHHFAQLADVEDHIHTALPREGL